jgi:PHD/YefM family antitoxin component YafN of YafNO toxin-antitoxin module
MTVTTLSSREFNQHASEAKKFANNGPVFITDRGKTAHVLLSIQDYQRLSGANPSIVELLAMPNAETIDFDPPKAQDFGRPAEFL